MAALEEVAEIATVAVWEDDAGELPGYLLGRERYNRLIDLLVELGALSEEWAKRKIEPPPESEAYHAPRISPPSWQASTPYALAGNRRSTTLP